MSSYNYIISEPQDNGVLLIKLNRPEARNALTTSLLTELAAELDAPTPTCERVECRITPVAMCVAGYNEAIAALCANKKTSFVDSGKDSDAGSILECR